MKILLQLMTVVAAAIALPLLPRLLWPGATGNGVERLTRNQVALWILALPLLCLAIVTNKQRALEFLRLNRFSGIAEPSVLFGIRADENWRRIGWQTGLVIAVITAIVMFAPLPLSSLNWTAGLSLLPLILLLSLSNSLGEELIFRHSVATMLEDTPWAKHAPVVSGVIFGGVHYFGAPGGFLGVLMAGALGYILTKSIRETRGLFWAWSIHFVLDVIIIAAILLAEVSK